MSAPVETIIEQLRYRRSKPTPETAAFQRAILRNIADGKPVSAAKIAADTGWPVEAVQERFVQMRLGGCEFNAEGALIGVALTQKPTHHHVYVNGQHLYAWCALDTLFIPAWLGQTAKVESTCPVTGQTITLTVSSDKVEAYSPRETVLSIVTKENCTPGPQGDFCGQIFFFASEDAAKQWVDGRDGYAIVPVEEAFQVAQAVYVNF
jgi:alkylmercury lyase